MLRKDDRAPDFRVTLPDGRSASLADYRGKPLLLIFLRHLACLPCQEHLFAVRDRLAEFQRHGTAVLVISFGRIEQVEGFRRRIGIPFPVATDPDRRAYDAYGMSRGSFWQIWGPSVIWKYVKLVSAGLELRKPDPGDDLNQLGGDFLVGRDGRILVAHPSVTPADRPRVEDLLAASG
ncbi:MAG: AhpC/TSA family protein [Deltaproteobacteria bacterium]|nr:AhpC/TSA family protein [Deltaproteobacteria bacterium]